MAINNITVPIICSTDHLQHIEGAIAALLKVVTKHRHGERRPESRAVKVRSPVPVAAPVSPPVASVPGQCVCVCRGPRDEGGTHWARGGSGGQGQARRTLPMEVERCPSNVVRVEGHARAGVGGRHKRGLRRRVGGGWAAGARRTLPMPSRRLICRSLWPSGAL